MLIFLSEFDHIEQDTACHGLTACDASHIICILKMDIYASLVCVHDPYITQIKEPKWKLLVVKSILCGHFVT